MPADQDPGYAFVVLLGDRDDAAELAGILDRLRGGARRCPAVIVTPPVRGLAFFADAIQQPDVDIWWSAAVPADAHPVYLIMHDGSLPDWQGGVDGTFYVGAPDAGVSGHYAACPGTRVFLCRSPLDFAVQVARDFWDSGVFDEAEAARILGVPPDRAVDQSHPTYPPQALADAPERSGSRPEASRRQPAPRGGAVRGGFLRPRRHGHRPMSDGDLARQLAGRGPTIVVMGSRKGGVGKTSFAAGIAVVAGTVLDQIGHSACIVDANLANPDAWGQMHLPTGAATVRDVVAALLANREPPPPVHAATPALACYPEGREPCEYSRTEIRRLADHLRRRHTFIVVDMSNRLPDPTAGPEAAVAAYWLEEGDVLVLPTTASRSDFDGVLDFLDVGGLPPTVVPYIAGTSKRLRDNPLTLQYLEAIRSRAAAVVEIPDDANAVRLAGMSGVPAERLSPSLRVAYRALTEAIAVMPRVGGSRR